LAAAPVAVIAIRATVASAMIEAFFILPFT